MTWILSKLAVLLPFQYYFIGAAAAGLIAFGGTQTWRLHTAQAGEATAKTALSDERAAAAKAALQATTAARAEEQRRAAAQKEIADATDKALAQARADGAAAAAAHGRLSDRAAAVASRCSAPGNPGAAIAGAPAEGAGLVLADVLRKSDERSGLLASYADEARAAGQACERSYDSLTVRP